VSSPHEVLGIEPDADDETILAAYRERIKEAHPDHGGSAEEFRAVRTAYERLKNGTDDADAARDNEWVRGTRSGYWEATEEDAAVEDDAEEGYRVEYIDYEVLEDYGWDIWDDDLFGKAAETNLDPIEYGELVVEPNQTLLEAAEAHGFAWPFACRGGACSNCAVAVIDGEIPEPTNHVLTPELIEEGIRLSCIAAPISEDTKVVYNVKHLPGVNELLLSPSRFEQAHSD